MREIFKLVILYDARRNAYTVWDHNLSPRMAEELIQDLRSKLLPAFAVNQRWNTREMTPKRAAYAARTCDTLRASLPGHDSKGELKNERKESSRSI